MGNIYTDKHKDDQNEGDLFYSSSKSQKLADNSPFYISESKPWTLVKGGKPGKTLILKLIQSEACENWFHDLFLKRAHGPRISVPKHLVTFDEKYLRRCLELMHVNASKGAPCSVSSNSSSLEMGLMPDYATKYAIDYPMGVGAEDLVLSPLGEGIVGSIMGSNSMMSILSSPLFQRLGVSDHDSKFGGTSLFENKRCVPSEYQGSPSRFTFSPSHRKEAFTMRNHGYRSDNSLQKSPISVSSGLSMLTDQSSLSPDSQGMLQCTWDRGIPNFAFSLDDQKDLYVANAWKVERTNDKAVDYVYSFHLKPSGQRMFDFPDNESDHLIGKMKVSTSFSLSSNNSKVMETEFVLVGSNENHGREIHTLSKNSRRSRRLSKVMEMFKTGPSLKQRTPSIFGGTSAIPEDFSTEKGLEACNNVNQLCRPDLSEDDFLPNLEMAAIVVKDHLQEEEVHQKEEVGGWGLKFLKKARVNNQTVAQLDASATSECSLRNVGNCSTSIDIIVPEGPHGGPKSRNGGPTGLVERWRLGGRCDCGGWDMGCPLKVLKARPRAEESWPSSEAQGNCKSFDIMTEGSKEGTPTLKMVNIHDGLYFISFQSSSLSALQCFSIVVAIIHSQSPSLRPKHVQD